MPKPSLPVETENFDGNIANAQEAYSLAHQLCTNTNYDPRQAADISLIMAMAHFKDRADVLVTSTCAQFSFPPLAWLQAKPAATTIIGNIVSIGDGTNDNQRLFLASALENVLAARSTKPKKYLQPVVVSYHGNPPQVSHGMNLLYDFSADGKEVKITLANSLGGGAEEPDHRIVQAAWTEILQVLQNRGITVTGNQLYYANMGELQQGNQVSCGLRMSMHAFDYADGSQLCKDTGMEQACQDFYSQQKRSIGTLAFDEHATDAVRFYAAIDPTNKATPGQDPALVPNPGPVVVGNPLTPNSAAPFPRAMGNQPVLAVDACRRAIDSAAAAGNLKTTWNSTTTCTVSDKSNTMLSTIEVKNGRLRQQLPLGASAGSITSQARIAALGLLALCGGKTSNVGINLRFDQHCDLEQTKALAFAMFAVLAQECPGKQIVLECGTMQAEIEQMYQNAYQESYQDMTDRFNTQNPEDDRAQQTQPDEQHAAQLNSDSEPVSGAEAQQHDEVELNALTDNSAPGQHEDPYTSQQVDETQLPERHSHRYD